MHVHFLRRARGLVVRHLSGDAQQQHERDGAARDVHGGVCAVQRRVVGVGGRRGRRRLRLHPVGRVVVSARALLEPLGAHRTAKSQEAAAAAVPVVRVVAREFLVVLAAHVVITQTGVVVTPERRGRTDSRDGCARRRGGHGGGSVKLLVFVCAPRRVFPLFFACAQRVQVDQEQQEVLDAHDFRFSLARSLALYTLFGARVLLVRTVGPVRVRTAAAPRASTAVTHLMLRTKSREAHESPVLHTHTSARAHFAFVPFFKRKFLYDSARDIKSFPRAVCLQEKNPKQQELK